MSYLGRRGATAPLNSADIPDDVVQGTDIAYLENDSTTQNLGGTYSTERMYLNDSYTLNDDVTVTGHLALGSIADSDVVITQDSTERTITGSGTIEAGNLLQDTHRTSVTGMTGELGSGVTLGSAVILDSGVKGGAMSKGTVSESSGTPTGDIFERGSNSNGEYVKHADGTMICTIKDIAASSGASVNWTFPASFASGTEPTCGGTSGADEHRIAASGSTDVTNTVWSFRAFTIVVGGHCAYTGAFMNLSAIGRWY